MLSSQIYGGCQFVYPVMDRSDAIESVDAPALTLHPLAGAMYFHHRTCPAGHTPPSVCIRVGEVLDFLRPLAKASKHQHPPSASPGFNVEGLAKGTYASNISAILRISSRNSSRFASDRIYCQSLESTNTQGGKGQAKPCLKPHEQTHTSRL
eukprot:464697-Rhodomonas_salina.1